jgi:hypothetical protein
MAWPLKQKGALSLEAFDLYLRSTKHLNKDSTAPQHARCMSYFFGMFEQHKGKFSAAGFLASFHKSGLSNTWAALDIMDAHLGNTRNMVSALKHFVDYLAIECGRKGLPVVQNWLNLFKLQVLDPKTKVTLLNSQNSDKYLMTHLFLIKQSLICSKGIITRS